jgi:hypothetical protein
MALLAVSTVVLGGLDYVWASDEFLSSIAPGGSTGVVEKAERFPAFLPTESSQSSESSRRSS